MHISIYSMTHTIYEGEISSITLPTQLGQITILDHHEPLISLLSKGDVILDKKTATSISSGILEINNQNEAKILVHS